MDILSPRDLYRLAPGSRPLSKKEAAEGHLIDTAKFLNDYRLVKSGFFPVFALQGTTHRDSDTDARAGRHLVIAAKDEGSVGPCLALLNSHCKLQRSWMMLGLWNGATMLVGCKVPLQRWKGYDEQLDNLLRELPILDKMRSRLYRAELSAKTISDLASRVQREGFKERGRPLASALLDAVPNANRKNFLSVAFGIVEAAKHGNLAPSSQQRTRRNIKGIRRPDMLVNVGAAAYQAAVTISQ